MNIVPKMTIVHTNIYFYTDIMYSAALITCRISNFITIIKQYNMNSDLRIQAIL